MQSGSNWFVETVQTSRFPDVAVAIVNITFMAFCCCCGCFFHKYYEGMAKWTGQLRAQHIRICFE